MKKTLKFGLLASTLGLTSCFSILPEPAPASSVYRLTTDTVRVEPLPDAPVIRIDTPSAARLLSGRDIVVSPDAKRLAVAGNAEWGDSLPNLIQQTFLDILGERNDLIGVIPISGARSNYRIHINVDNFEARFDNGPESPPIIIIAYSATLANSGTRNLIGTKLVTEKERASSVNVSSIVDSMDASNRRALNQIADWVSDLELPE